MKYNRLTRELFFDVDGKEYSIRPTNGVLSKIESVCPKGESLISLTVDNRPPTMPLMVETFCAGLTLDGKKVERRIAESLCDKYIQENGVAGGLMNLYYVVMAVSNFLGKEASDNILKSMNVENVDTEPIKKNSQNSAHKK